MSTPQPRAGYCAAGDLLLGNLPLPQWMSPEQVIGAAADEIDSRLGFVYAVPILTESPGGTAPADQIPPFVGLALKRINASLATGRAILQIDAAGENERLHAYGLSLVQEALSAIEAIANGSMILPNVPTVSGDLETSGNAPLISNLDPESAVEAFYNRIANPEYCFYPSSIPVGDGHRLRYGGY